MTLTLVTPNAVKAMSQQKLPTPSLLMKAEIILKLLSGRLVSIFKSSDLDPKDIRYDPKQGLNTVLHTL